jgi:hypothetical protein
MGERARYTSFAYALRISRANITADLRLNRSFFLPMFDWGQCLAVQPPLGPVTAS